MTKAVTDLLTVAVALATVTGDAELQDAIEAVEFLGDEANGKSQEYKDLKAKVEELEAIENAKEPTPPTSTTQDTKNVAPVKTKNYMGIKMIGNRWYSMKDKYKKAFETADECADHFNK